MKQARVLVVDGDEPIRRLLMSVLADEGYEVDGAANAGEAASFVVGRPPDLALVDPFMVGMRPEDCVGGLFGRCGIPVIVVSAVPRLRSVAMAHSQAWLEKPFELDTLLATVETAAPGHNRGYGCRFER